MLPFEISEPVARMSIFAAVLVALAGLEAMLPRRRRVETRTRRWFTNVALIAIDTIAVRIAVPIVAITAAESAAAQGWGLFNLIDWAPWLEIVLAIVLLDLFIYGQHVASHKIPILWTLHKVHHADRDMDVTTGFRFHPIEIILSMVFKILCIFLLGPAAIAVFLFEVVLSSSAMFNHANMQLPSWLDRIAASGTGNA